MSVLIGIALKSLLIAGLALGLLELMKRRSAAERSWVAHIGLLGLVIMAVAPVALPSWSVAVPTMFVSAPEAVPAVVQQAPPAIATTTPTVATPAVKSVGVRPSISPTAAATAAYAVPAAILLFITFLALARLVMLRARAEVLVDAHWLSALARAQRRMGFKHGTALLTSDDLGSPISWGLIRPVILLNTRAVEASAEAEAIIAHELAHVARMDWAKLLLARVATALFWFNPFVWILAREAHQLREEAADDSVLAADIADTDYAQLLVGIARHECPSLLLGAHGVAPSKNSLTRRVARVLDGKTVRGPVARSFAAGVFVGAIAVAAPLAALTLAPAKPQAAKAAGTAKSASSVPVDTSKAYYSAPEVPTDLPHIIAQGVSTAVVAATGPGGAEQAREAAMEKAAEARQDAIDAAQDAADEAREATKDAVRQAQLHNRGNIGLQAMGITPEYVGEMRRVAPQFARMSASDFAGMRAVGVTPDYARDLIAAGFPRISDDEIVGARTVGLTGSYVRAMKQAGVRGDLDDFVSLRTVGVDPSFAMRARKGGHPTIAADDLIELRALGRMSPPAPPRPPRAALPAASPPNWDPPGSDPGG
jgi:bla regulator protein BlaR1